MHGNKILHHIHWRLNAQCGETILERAHWFFFGNFRSEIQTWESTSFGAKLGKKRGNQQVFTK